MIGEPVAADPLLRVESLVTDFRTDAGILRAVNGVSYHVNPGEALGVVGESGSGKSATVMSLLRLLPRTARVSSGSVWFDGRDLLTLKEREMEEIRGKQISMIFQDPMTALNPIMTIGRQIAEGLARHNPGLSGRAATRQAIDLLAEVGIPDPRQRVSQYPHEFSGGMRQRAMIAIAMANRPKLIIADEPTTALDVTIQAQILDLLRRLQHEHGSALIFITHDLGVIAEMVDRVVVMYAGRAVEVADVDDLFHGARHPYTHGLLDSLPRLEDHLGELPVIPGQPPSPMNLPSGCAFRPRCGRSAGRASCEIAPELRGVGKASVDVGVPAAPAPAAAPSDPSTPTATSPETGHLVACHFPDEDRATVTLT